MPVKSVKRLLRGCTRSYAYIQQNIPRTFRSVTEVKCSVRLDADTLAPLSVEKVGIRIFRGMVRAEVDIVRGLDIQGPKNEVNHQILALL